MMKIFITAIFLFSAVLMPLVGGQHTSVPLGHRVYRVIESGELRGLIPKQIAAKPYPASKAVSLLEQMEEQANLLSETELKEIALLKEELSYPFETEDFLHMLRKGSFRSFDDRLNFGISLGAGLDGQLTVSPKTEEYDARSSFRAVMRGDILDFASVYMDFGLRWDKLNNRVFLNPDFSIPGEGFYYQMVNATGSRLKEIPADGYILGHDYYPELSLSFLSHALQFRFGSIHRDWGVGHNSLQLSGTARPFDGFEGHIHFSDWVRYSFIVGSLGIFSLEEIDGVPFFSDSLDDREGYRFSNNISAKRAEADLPGNFTFGIFESCIWQKRFEIAYLNPFGILMFQQNQLGDLDNMLAGVDLQWRLPGYLRLHGTWATTEMNEISPSRFFTAARNIMAYQGGADAYLPFGAFSTLSIQYTRLDAFFYSHYPHEEEFLHPIYRGDENQVIETAYVNKGENLGYPLNPNSDELKVNLHAGLGDGWESFITVKYQRRSGQYGFTVDQYINYSEYSKGTYEDKNFSKYIFERAFSAELGVSKRLQVLPMTLFGSYRFSRIIDRDRNTDLDDDINHTYAETWNTPVFDHVFQIGFSLFGK